MAGQQRCRRKALGRSGMRPLR